MTTNNTQAPLPQAAYKLLIVFATLIWGFSFVVMKDALDLVDPYLLLTIRFALTTLILALIWRRPLLAHLNRSHLRVGAALGLSEGAAYLFQNVGLMSTTPGRNAFLTAVYCIIVPFLWWVIAGRRPGIARIVAAVLGIVGVGFLSLQGDLTLALGKGDALTLIGAFFFAVQIVIISRAAPTHDVPTLTVIQMAGIALLSLVSWLVSGGSTVLPQVTPELIWQMTYLVVFASCIAMGAQNIAQEHVNASQAALLLSLESVFGVLFSIFLYGERLTPQMLLGFNLIFVAIMVSELAAPAKPPHEGKVGA